MLTSKRFINTLDQPIPKIKNWHRGPCQCLLLLVSANNCPLWWSQTSLYSQISCRMRISTQR